MFEKLVEVIGNYVEVEGKDIHLVDIKKFDIVMKRPHLI